MQTTSTFFAACFLLALSLQVKLKQSFIFKKRVFFLRTSIKKKANLSSLQAKKITLSGVKTISKTSKKLTLKSASKKAALKSKKAAFELRTLKIKRF